MQRPNHRMVKKTIAAHRNGDGLFLLLCLLYDCAVYQWYRHDSPAHE